MRRSILFVAIICAVVLLAAGYLPLHRWFADGSPILAERSRTMEIGGRLGTFGLAGGQFYLVQMRGDAAHSFQIAFASPDGTHGQPVAVNRRAFSGRNPFWTIIRAERSVAEASLEFLPGSSPLPGGIQFAQLSVQPLNRSYGFWIKATVLVRWAASLILAAAAPWMLWLVAQGRTARERHRSDPATLVVATASRGQGAVIFWALLLLLVGGLMEPFFVWEKVSGLFDRKFPHPAIKGWDDSFYYFWLRSVMVDRDVDFSNDLLYCNTFDQASREQAVRETPRTATGLLPNKYPIGWALAELPWYLAADATAHVVNLGGAHIPYDGWAPLYQVALVLGQMVYAVASLYFAGRFVAEYVPGWLALCGVMLAWLGSALLYYQTLGVTMSHNTMFFAVVSAHWFALRLRRHPASIWNWALVGGLCALAILARYQGAVLLVFPGMVCLRLLAGDFRRMAPRFGLAVVTGSLLLSLQMLAWKLVYGSVFLYTYQGETFSWLRPHLLESWFSPFHGLFYWHPAVFVALAGFCWWAVRTERRVDALCFAVSLGLVLYINAAWDCWSFGASFGARAFDGSMLFAMLGLAALLDGLLRWRPAAFHLVAGTLFVLGGWNLDLVMMADKSRLDFGRPVAWSEMVGVSVKYWSER